MFVKRDMFSDVKNTGQSFKSWGTCMSSVPCKVIVIVCIVIGSLIALWVLTTLFRCCFYGLACTEACCGLCCRCCGSKSQPVVYQQPQPVRQYGDIPVYTNTEKIHPYDNMNMYPPRNPPNYLAQETNNSYQYSPHPTPQQAHVYNQGYQPVNTYNDENPFETKHSYRGNF